LAEFPRLGPQFAIAERLQAFLEGIDFFDYF